MTVDQMFPHRITILTGHYGTGKTECSVNLALSLAECVPNVILADLDIVNPYFRSRERKLDLEQAGVELIATSDACIHADVPSLPPRLMRVFDDSSCRCVLDIGGDPVGARVLARYQSRLRNDDFQMLFVLNANRPEVRTPEQAAQYMKNIESVTGLPYSGILNNTHLCSETTPHDILSGAVLAQETARLTGVPLVCHAVRRDFLSQLSELKEPIFPINIMMKKPWE